MDEGHALIAEPPTPTAAEPAPAELQYLDLNVGQTYKVIVSYAESPYVVWCQRTEYRTEFDHLVSGMALKYASPTQIPLLSNPSVDRVCAVLYAYDQTWCRGVIQSVDKTSQTAEVLFVDFGNTESFKLSELKELLPEFLTVPAQAISFSMEGISPRGGGDDWSAKAIAKFQEMTVEGGFLCKVVGEDQDGYPAAHLLDPTAGNKNIGHEMARFGLADGPVMAPKSSPREATSGFSSNHLPQSSSHSSSRSGSQPGSQSGSHHGSQSGTPHRTQTYSQFHSQTQQKTSPFQSQKSSPFQSQKSSPGGSPYRSPKPPREAVTLSYTRPRIGSGQAYDVFVSQVVSPSDFYSQLQSSAINIDTLSTEIEKHCSSSEARKVTSPRPGMPILAKFSEDQCWYRALIKATPARDECTVSFVDFGNSETVKLTNVRELPPKLINLPAQAFRCTLFGFFADSSPEVTSLFMDLVLEDSIRCFVKSTSKDDELPLHSVELTTSKKVSVLEALAASKRKSTTPQRETAAVKKTPPVPRIPANSNVDVCISFVETPGKFYVQLTECYTTLDRLTEGLNQTYQNQSNRKATLPKPEVGAFCCTQFSEDRVWYRARVTALHGSEAEVLYIDYGNSERVKNSDLLVLDNQFAADPALAIPCTFEGLSPAILSSREMGGRLSKLTLEKTLVAQFARPLSSLDDCIPVKIIDTSKPGSDVNVAESLQSGTGARQTGMEIPRQKLELGLPVACTVAFAVSPSEFYCQLVSEAEKFDELMNRMYAFYAEQNAGSEIREPSFGMFCAAPFSDSSWYRSKITKTTTSGHVTLFYADYGNIEEVPSPDIRLLESQFCHQPIQALRCSLNGVGPAGDSWSEEACSMFQEAVLEQEARVTFLQEAAGGYEVELQFREQDIAQKMTDAGLAVKKTAAATQRGEQLLVPGLQLRKSATYDVIVTAASSPLDFYCQVVDPEEKLDVLMDRIDHHCSTTSAPTNRSYKPGEIVLACFTEDQGWYRAAIATAPQGGNTVEVRYIDYGNAEEVGTSELRSMTPAFCQLPSQAVWCQLIGVEDYSLSEDALASLNDLLLNSEVQLRCVSMATADRYTVDLIRKEDGVSLISHAIEVGIVPAKVKSIKPHPPAQTPDQTPIVIPTAFPHVEPESFHDVVVVYGESPNAFYCQFSLNTEELDTLMSKMQEFYAANRKDPPAKCTKGSFLAAQFSEDQLWYRAQVCAVSADGVEVCFVDYGNREVVPSSRLQFLAPEFATLPSQAIPCSLAGVSPLGSSWSAVAIDSFLEIALAQSLVAQIGSAPESGRAFSFGDGQKLKLSLIDSSGEGELVAHKLIGVVVADSSPTTPSAQSPQATAATPPKSKMSENVIEAGSQHEAYVCHLVSPGAFWLQLAASEEALARLSNRLAAVYDSSEVESLALKEPETGMSCCARFSEDQCWYRGVVRSVTSTGCLVHFVDYGNSETVALADVKFLKPEFLDLQVQAIKCSLVGCHPENQSDEDITRFSDLVTEKLLLAEFVRGSAEQWEVKVDVAFALPELPPEKTEEAKEEAREPAEGSQALPAADPSVRPSGGMAEILELQLTEGDTYDVFVTHTVLPTEFYCQIASDSEALETLMARVADYYNSSRSSTPAIQAGISCVAQYSGNNAWYRAKIVDVELDGAVTVYFVDYGNCEAVLSSNILTLHPDFASLPSQAICCSLTPNIGHPFTDEKLEEFFSLDFEQQFRMTITGHQQRLYFVDLVDMVGASVNEMLLSEMELEEAIAVPGGQPSYIPLQYSVGASIDVYISFVASPTSFYCQPLKLAGELDAMMTELAVAVTTSPLGRSENIAPGDICLAQYSADSEWYRASVVGVPCEGKALVNFVDYGNSEVVDVDVMVPLPTAFLATKLQAIHCSVFHEIGAEIEWAEEKIKAFQGLFGEDQNYTITMTGRATDGRYVVDISSNGHAIDFSHLLEQEAGPVTVETPEEDVPIPSSSLFRPIPADDLLIPSAAQGVDLSMLSNDANEISMASVMAVKGSKTPSTEVETDSENGGEGEPLIRAPFKLSLAVQEVLEASIVFVQSPSMLYIQRTDCQGELDALAEEIEQYCASFPDKQFQPGFHPGDFVLAKYAVDDSWYRAEVVEVRADSTVEVSFIDYGNVESISPDKLIMCPEHFLDLPAQAIPCSLAHVPRRESWPSEYKELIDSLVEGKVLRVTVVLPASLGMRPTVTLEDLESATEISNQVLVKLQEECDLGASTLGDDVIIEEREELEGEIPDDGEPPTGDDITPNQGPPGLRKLSLPERQFEIGTSHEVFIASCQSPHSFLCQLASEAEVLDTITTQLAQTYASSEETTELENLPEEGDYVCAQFSEDGQWYRSQVLGSEGNDLAVLYIDFGNSEVLPLTSLRVLGENLASYPPMAFECFLSGVESLTGDGQFDQTAADRMLELIGEGAVTMEIVSTDTAGHLGVALTSSEGVNIGASLIEAGLAAELLQTPLTTPSTATLQSSHSTEIPTAADTPKAAPFEVSIPESEEPIPIPGEVTVPEGTEESPVGVSLPESIPVVLPAATTALEYAMSYSKVTISSGTRFQVTVASVSSPDNFTCQTLTEGSEALVREIAAEGYSIGSDSLTVRAPTAGQPVCVCCSRDNTWCRAKITSVDQAPNTISVEYIDLGFSEVLTLEKVKYLKKVFASAHPPRALHCSLQPLTERDLGPSALETEDAWELVWPRSCSAHLAELTRGKEGVSIEVTGTNEEGHFIVKLMDTSGEVDVDIREAIVAKLREPKALPLDNDTSDDEEFHDALDVESELQLDEAGAGRGGGAVEVDDEEPAVEQFQDASDVMEDIQQETPTAAVVGGDVATVVPLEDSASAEPSVTAEDVAMTEPSVTAEGVATTEPVVAEEDRTIAESPTLEKDSTTTEPPDSLTVKPPAEDSTMAEPPETADSKPPAEDSIMAEPPETANGLTVRPPAEDSTMAEPPETANGLTVKPPAEDSTMAEPPETANGLTVTSPAEDSTMAEPPETANGLTVTPPAEDSTMAEPPETADSLTVTSPAEDSSMAEPPETANGLTVKPPAEDSTMAEPPETANGLTVKPPAEDSTMAEPPETANGLTVTPPVEDATMAEPPETADSKPPAEDSAMAEPPETADSLTVKPPAEDSTMAEPPETANGLTVTPPAEDSTMAEPPETANGLTVKPPAEDSTMAEPPETANGLTVTPPAEDSTMAEPSETADSKPPAEDSTMAEPPETADGLTVKPPEDSATTELHVPGEHLSTAESPSAHEDSIVAEPPTSDEDSTMADPDSTRQSEATAEDTTAAVVDEDSTVADHSLADIADSAQQECAELPTELGEQLSSEPSVTESAQDVAAAGSGEGEEQPPDTGELSEVAAGGEKVESDTVAATEPSIERTPTEDTASEPLPPEPLPQEPPVAVEQTQDEITPTDVSSDPVTGDTDVSSDPVTGDTDVSSDPVTGDTDVSSDPVTGDTDVSSDPVTGDTDINSDPVTGDTDRTPLPESVAIAPMEPSPEGMEPKQAKEISDEFGSTSEQTPATEEEEAVPVMEREEGGVETVPVVNLEEGGVVSLLVSEGEEEGVESVPVTEGEEERVESVPVTEGEEEGVEPVTDGEEERVRTVSEGEEERVEPVTDGEEERVEPVTDGEEERVEPVTEGEEERVEPVTEGEEERVEPLTDGEEERVEPLTDGEEERVEPVTEGEKERAVTIAATEGEEKGEESAPVTEGEDERVETIAVTEGEEEGEENMIIAHGIVYGCLGMRL